MQGIAGNKVSTGTQLLDTANAFLVQILPFLVCHRVDDAFLIIHKCQVFHLFFSFRLASSSSFCRCFSRPSLGSKSSRPKMGRSSRCTLPLASSFGHFLAHSIASCMVLTSIKVYPAISSLVSAKGPSITMGSPLLNSMRAPNSLGLRPLPSTQTPALIKASL